MIDSAIHGRREGQRQCPLCLTWVQRSLEGDLADGMRQHYLRLHPGKETPRA